MTVTGEVSERRQMLLGTLTLLSEAPPLSHLRVLGASTQTMRGGDALDEVHPQPPSLPG